MSFEQPEIKNEESTEAASNTAEMLAYEPQSKIEQVRFDEAVSEFGKELGAFNDDPEMTEEKREGFLKRFGSILGAGALGIAHIPEKIIEHLVTPNLKVLRGTFEELATIVNNSVENILPVVTKILHMAIDAGGQVVETGLGSAGKGGSQFITGIGEGSAKAAASVLREVPPAAGRGTGSMLREFGLSLAGK